MRIFISSAFPWIMTGIALAILVINCSTRKKSNKAQWVRIAIGAALGIVFGMTLNYCGLCDNHILVIAFGLIWGMSIGSIYEDKGTSHIANDCERKKD